MKTGELGRKCIIYYEQINDGNLSKIGYQPKMDCSSIWTCGIGHALKDINGKWLKGESGFKRLLEIYPDLETITKEEAIDLLEEDLEQFETQLNSLNLKLTNYQYDALISLIFNIGFGNFLSSTLLRRIRGEKGSIAEAFKMWSKSNGKILKGLIKRRNTESILFETGELKF